jgi:hypothetical protein
MSYQRFVLIGNGFDLAHGLKTSYGHFVDWYMCQCFDEFVKHKRYSDCLVDFSINNSSTPTIFQNKATTTKEVIDFLKINDYQKLKYNSHFFKRLIEDFNSGNWIDIERNYFYRLTTIFNSVGLAPHERIENVIKLNIQFNFIISKLSHYIEFINQQLQGCKTLFEDNRTNLYKAFQLKDDSPVTFVNFNYTDTLQRLNYANENEIIHIHGQVSNKDRNPIIFGYGDETAPEYQQIEDTGENVYLEHIKSFGYFKTRNYSKLITAIDNGPYLVSIVGLSCGLSDRIMLSEIFEHENCRGIDIFFYQQSDGSDNHKETTMEISRHFKPQNKGMFRRRVIPYKKENYIPQNSK